MAYKYTCDNSYTEEVYEELKKFPLRKRKKKLQKDCSFAMFHRVSKLFDKPFVPPVKEIVASTEEALHLLNKCFLINKNVKKNAYTHSEYINEYGEEDIRTDVDYSLRDREYSRKTAIIKTVINMIIFNNLKINYWKKD